MKKKGITVVPKWDSSKKKGGEKTLASALLQWLNTSSNTTSIHGFNWIARINNVYLKVLLFMGMNIVSCIVVAALVSSGLEFNADKSIQSTRVSSQTGNISFPQMTICHPWYFEREAFLGKYIYFLIRLRFLFQKCLLKECFFSPMN